MSVSPAYPLGSEPGGRRQKKRDGAETRAETADLKSLARLVLARDTGRDSGRDALSRNCLVADADTRQQIGGVSLSRLPRGETPRQPAPLAYARTFAALERQCPDH